MKTPFSRIDDLVPPRSSSLPRDPNAAPPHKTRVSDTAGPRTAGVPLRGHSYPRRQRRTNGPARHSRRNPRGCRGHRPETGDHGGSDAKVRESLTLNGDPLPERGTWHPVPYLLHNTHTLIDVYYLSHAFPRQMNHQQRKPTRPPTTTTAATEIPAIAPAERLGSLPVLLSPLPPPLVLT